MNKKEREEEREREKKTSIGREIWEYVRLILIVVAAVIFVTNVLIINARIPSESMENTIMAGDQIFGNRLAYAFGDPERYDIVIFRYPDDESQLFIKRIIGLPGEDRHDPGWEGVHRRFHGAAGRQLLPGDAPGRRTVPGRRL